MLILLTNTLSLAHTVNFGRQQEEVSLMVEQEIFSRAFLLNGKKENWCWELRGTTAAKHDETGGEAAARVSSPVRLTVCFPVCS